MSIRLIRRGDISRQLPLSLLTQNPFRIICAAYSWVSSTVGAPLSSENTPESISTSIFICTPFTKSSHRAPRQSRVPSERITMVKQSQLTHIACCWYCSGPLLASQPLCPANTLAYLAVRMPRSPWPSYRPV